MSFIKPAFEFAKKYAPEGTKLYYNDFNEYMPQKTDAIIKMVEEINSDGHYIDGIGMQSHLDARSGSDAFPSVNVYKKALDKFCETGLDVQVTELDVTVNDKDHFKEQAQYYSDIMDTIVAQKDNISSVTFWGTTDDMSWRASKYPLLFNEDYTAKESFYAIIDGIESTGTTTTTTKPSETTTTTTTTATTEKPSETTTTATPSGDTVYGDANEDGEVDISDAVLIMQSLANPDMYKLTEQGKKNADVVGNDGISTNDALAIQMIGINLIKLEDLPLDDMPKFE